MNFLLDTNAVSEPRRKRPNVHFCDWLDKQDQATLHTSTVTLAELWQGWHSLADDHPDRDRLRAFVENVPRAYRLLKFDEPAAARWGEITASGRDPLPLRDSLIAAIALARGFRIVTRDEAPFRRAGCKVVNPWKS